MTMRMRASFLTLAALTLAACGAQVPDSGAGVGFQDYDSYLREQEAAAARAPVTGAMAPAAGTGFSTDIAAAAIDRATGVAPAAAPLNTAPLSAAPVYPTPTSAVPQLDPNAPLDPNRPRGRGAASRMNRISTPSRRAKPLNPTRNALPATARNTP